MAPNLHFSNNMAQSMPAAGLAPRITTRAPRTSLIDAEWEWLARRADDFGFDDGDRVSDRVTSPGLAPTTPIVMEQPSEVVLMKAARGQVKLTLAFVATALFSYLLGVATLPVNAAITSRLRQASASEYVAAALAPLPSPPPALASEPVLPEAPAVVAPVLVSTPREPEAKPLRSAKKQAAAQPVRGRAPARWAPQRSARPPTDNPY